MSSSNYPITILSDYDIEDAFSFTITPNYSPASPDYFSASPRKTSSDPSEDLSKYLLASLAISPFYDDPYMKVMQAYNATSNESPISLPQAPIAPPTVLPSSVVLSLSPIESSHKTHLERHEEQIKTILNHLDELPLERIEQVEEKIEGLGNDQDIKHMISPTPSPDYPLIYLSGRKLVQNKYLCQLISIPLCLKILTKIWILILCCLVNVDRMAPKRKSTSAVPAMNQAAIRKLVADSVAIALEAQVASMANTDNTNRNTGPRETLVARKCSYKEFISCQLFNFKGTKGAVGLIHWFELTESVFSRSNYIKDCKVKFATCTLTEEALS
nr:reverse transcriptase domain-containing protein [Tanacetum cinerariifolium]